MQIGGAKPLGFGLANIVQHIGDDDVGAFSNKALGTAQANATGCASNDGGTVLEFHSCLLVGVEISAVRFQHERGYGQVARAAQGKER